MHTLDFVQPVKPLVARVERIGEVHVEQHHIGVFHAEDGRKRDGRGQGNDVLESAFQKQLQGRKHAPIIVDDEYGSWFCHGSFFFS